MSKKIMETTVNYMRSEDCEFPVKESSKRSRKQRQKAAKKNKFPVGLRKEISGVRRDVKERDVISYRRSFEKSERKIMDLILQDVKEEKENLKIFGDPFKNPEYEGPYEDTLFYEFWRWRDEQRKMAAEQQALREEFGY